MRILHISTRLIIGGSQENTILSCEGQTLRGHEVHLAYGPIYGPEGSMLPRVRAFRASAPPPSPTRNAPPPSPTGEVARAQQVPEGVDRVIQPHEIPHLFRELIPISDIRAYFELRNLIRRIKPDVVHTHSSKAGILGRAAAWHEGGSTGPIRIVHTIHGTPFHPYQSKRLNQLYIASERWAAQRCHAIVSVADDMTRQFLAHGIGRPDQYTTVYSGMEVDSFLNPVRGETREEVRAALGFGPTDLVLGTVARLADLKGHDDILDALADDLRRVEALRLLWVGDGWWRPRLEQRLDAMGLRPHTVLAGLVQPERIPGLMRAMDLLIHPSYHEGLPRAVPQALLCGVPVVAYDVDGTREVIADQTTGRLVLPGDRTALREAVLWMLDDAPRRRAIAERGRELCRERFDAAVMVDRLEEVYARALDR